MRNWKRKIAQKHELYSKNEEKNFSFTISKTEQGTTPSVIVRKCAACSTRIAANFPYTTHQQQQRKKKIQVAMRSPPYCPLPPVNLAPFFWCYTPRRYFLSYAKVVVVVGGGTSGKFWNLSKPPCRCRRFDVCIGVRVIPSSRPVYGFLGKKKLDTNKMYEFLMELFRKSDAHIGFWVSGLRLHWSEIVAEVIDIFQNGTGPEKWSFRTEKNRFCDYCSGIHRVTLVEV